MKKNLIGILLVIFLLLGQATGAYAALGDIEAYTTYTDICAYINHYIIESYNINGYTVVIAEDLANYGFDVIWDGDLRRLNITRNYNTNNITPYSIPYETAPNMVGKQALPVLSTDIKTFVNGVEAKSYNVDGRTVVDFESLSAFGPVQWNPELRNIKLWVEDGLTMRTTPQTPTPLPKTMLYSADGRTIRVYDSEVNNYLAVGWYQTYQAAMEANKPTNNSVGVYRTPTGKRYHFDPDCGGKNSYSTTLQKAKSAGLTPCKKCAQ